MKRKLFTVVIMAFCGIAVSGQNMRKMYEYDFDGALAEFRDSLELYADSLKRAPFEQAARWAENGISLTEYCQQPAVVARKRFHRDEFFLYYPLDDLSWHAVRDTSAFVFGTPDKTDTLRLPVRDSLEFLPMICGQERYFASRDLYGMGGYDLYVSRWDESRGDWGEPENLGFPYSSPYDDFLFVNTEDGRFSIFASNRECPADSVNVYVVEYEANPVHSAVSDPVKLRQIAGLNPRTEDPAAPGPVIRDEQTGRYMEKIAEVRSYRNRVSEASRELDRLRDRYLLAEGDEKARIASELAEGEMNVTGIRAGLDKASRELRDIETDFLLNGVEIDISGFMEEEREASSAPAFEFTRHRMGSPVTVVYCR